jgi:hypothetical protein
MAFTHGKSAQFWITDSGSTERELTDYVRNVTLPRSVDTAETSTFGDDDKTYVVGLRDATLSVEGLYDATVDGYLSGLLGAAPRAFAFCPQGSASSRVKYAGTVILTSYEPNADLGDAVGFSAEFQVTGAITRSTI